MGLQRPITMMSSDKKADIVFCIDHSGSMSDCIAGVKATVKDFVSSLEKGVEGQSPVDCQIGLVSYSQEELLFFDLTKDTEAFKTKLGQDVEGGNEFTPGAIDFAVSNASWRMGAQRVIVVFTDERLSTGGSSGEGDGRSKFDDLLKKIVDSNVQIIYYGPSCPYYSKFNVCPKAEVNIVDDFSGVRFDSLMKRLAVTVSSNSAAANNKPAVKTIIYNKAKINIKK